MSEYHAGRVRSVIFENDAQSFYILDMLLDGQSSADETIESGTTVRGNVPGLDVKPGTWFGFEGHWENHAKYGRQLVVDRAPVIKGSWDAETALKMLQSHGVGGRTCDSLHAQFGNGLIDVLSDAGTLQTVPGISEFAAQHIVSRWRAVRAMFQSLEFLGELKLPKKRIEQIYAHFGDDAERLLSEDPWSLVQIDGINFDQADEVARKLCLDLGSESRIRGAALYTCKARRGMGHLYLSSGELVKGITQYAPEIDKTKIARTLKDLDTAQMIILQLAFWTLGVGTLLGAWWADHSWGRWWAFDPKETWALITWIIYLIVIHVRIGSGARKGLLTAWLSVLGFIVMLWTYFGVNLLLPGLHAYA